MRAVGEPAQGRVLPPDGPPDLEKVGAAAQQYGVEILGPPPGAQVQRRGQANPIRRSAWKGRSANFAFTGFSEVRIAPAQHEGVPDHIGPGLWGVYHVPGVATL